MITSSPKIHDSKTFLTLFWIASNTVVTALYLAVREVTDDKIICMQIVWGNRMTHYNRKRIPFLKDFECITRVMSEGLKGTCEFICTDFVECM